MNLLQTWAGSAYWTSAIDSLLIPIHDDTSHTMLQYLLPEQTTISAELVDTIKQAKSFDHLMASLQPYWPSHQPMQQQTVYKPNGATTGV